MGVIMNLGPLVIACASALLSASPVNALTITVLPGEAVANGNYMTQMGVNFQLNGQGLPAIANDGSAIIPSSGYFTSWYPLPGQLWSFISLVDILVDGDAGTALDLITFTGAQIRYNLDDQPGYERLVFAPYDNYWGASFIARGRVQVSQFTISVPEPQTWAILIVGLGFVGGAVRLRGSTTRCPGLYPQPRRHPQPKDGTAH